MLSQKPKNIGWILGKGSMIKLCHMFSFDAIFNPRPKCLNIKP